MLRKAFAGIKETVLNTNITFGPTVLAANTAINNAGKVLINSGSTDKVTLTPPASVKASEFKSNATLQTVAFGKLKVQGNLSSASFTQNADKTTPLNSTLLILTTNAITASGAVTTKQLSATATSAIGTSLNVTTSNVSRNLSARNGITTTTAQAANLYTNVLNVSGNLTAGSTGTTTATSNALTATSFTTGSCAGC